MYIFTIIGTLWFGGYINTGVTSDDDHRFPTIDPVSGKNYLLNNFNDFASGFVLLFEIIIINNW